MKLKSTFLILLLFVSAFAFTGCNAGKGKPVKIGLIATLSDNDPPTGLEMERAAELAMKEIADEGLNNRKNGKVEIELIIEDDYGRPESSVEAARKLIYRDEADAIIGPQFSSNAIPVANLAEKAQVLMIAPMSTNPKTTEGKDFVFRVPFTDLLQAEAMARFAYEDLKISTIGVLYNISDKYSSGLANAFKTIFENFGGNVPAFENYTYDTNQNFTKQLSLLKKHSPEALYLPNYNEDVMLQVSQAEELGMKAVLLGGDGWSDTQTAEIEAFEGAYLTRHWHPDAANTEAKEIAAAYRETYGKNPDDVFMNTYDAFCLLFESIRDADEITPAGMRDALTEMDHFKGVSGTFYYDRSGDPQKQVMIVKIEGKKVRLFKIFHPERR